MPRFVRYYADQRFLLLQIPSSDGIGQATGGGAGIPGTDDDSASRHLDLGPPRRSCDPATDWVDAEAWAVATGPLYVVDKDKDGVVTQKWCMIYGSNHFSHDNTKVEDNNIGACAFFAKAVHTGCIDPEDLVMEGICCEDETICDDGDECTFDSCNSHTGVCAYPNKSE